MIPTEGRRAAVCSGGCLLGAFQQFLLLRLEFLVGEQAPLAQVVELENLSVEISGLGREWGGPRRAAGAWGGPTDRAGRGDRGGEPRIVGVKRLEYNLGPGITPAEVGRSELTMTTFRVLPLSAQYFAASAWASCLNLSTSRSKPVFAVRVMA